MIVSPDGLTVRFRTAPKELFLAEKSGVKPNIVRILDLDEWRQVKKHDPKKIVIQHQQEVFLRTLTNICSGGVILGKVIAIFSWQQDKLRHDAEPVPDTAGLPKEEPSIDERFVAITVSKGTLGLIQSIAHGRSINSVIKELYEVYMSTLFKEGESLYDR